MCLVLPKEIEPRILEEDLIVYKEVSEHLGKAYAIFYFFEYQEGILYETEIKESTDFACYGSEDSIATEKYAENSGYYTRYTVDNWRKKSGLFRALGKGFHSMTKERALRHWCNVSICKFIIPKGATVYEWNGLYVSNKIMMR